MIRYIRQSQFSKYRDCKRSWEMEYVRGLQFIRSPEQTKGARDLGTLVHLLVETYYSGGDWKQVLREQEALLVEGGHFSKEWQDIYSYAGVMMQGYVEWLGVTAADANEEVLVVEQGLEAHLGTFHGDDVILTGKPDLIVRDTLTDLVIVTDTKTVQQIVDDPFIHGDQLRNYGLLAKLHLDLDVNVSRLNQLRKVKRTGTSKPPFYGRCDMVLNKTTLRRQYVRVQAQLDEMVERMQYWEQKGDSDWQEYDRLFYPSPTRDCTWKCDFVAVCKAMDDGSNYNHIINSYYEKKPDYTPEESHVE